MQIHAVYLGGAPYVTTSHVLAADFRAWGHRVDTYTHDHHNVLALLTIQRAEGFEQTAREAELMDLWCAEWIGRWGFEARVGAMLSEREDLGTGASGSAMWDLGGALGMGRDSFTEEGRAIKVGRGRSWGMGSVWAWFGGGVGRSNAREEVHVDGDVLPPYTKGEAPPAYEQ
ncbi:uncharacterized protein CC84DRAFT_1213396 [Paraphaeosphaeria sporulosa]|uniref:Uncharacterized protein n=1 Tax=Paraphaeosphaeria sporulosa TaxID=1460663 RepID=A0A177CRW2_9PLEO|nr:uncharacterized protein CC84DRAFT_1213396 [Paraphaeosphaeria sporulosa]OAG10026.1 hypothetical protein CC84DRAFT_1213396 [Paraphaeosphaeria sporulosa]